MNFNDFNSDFEREIFDSVNVFSTHFSSIDLTKKEILEMIAIAFYGGRFITKSQSQLNSYNFEKYIKETIDYYTNFLTLEILYSNKLSNDFSENEKTYLNGILNNELNNYLEKEKKSKNSVTYVATLNFITNFVKNKYMTNKNEYLYASNVLYKDYVIRKYTNINALKYVQYLVIKENLDDFLSLFSHYKNGKVITKNDIINIFNSCDDKTTFVYDIYKFLYNIYQEKVNNNDDLNYSEPSYSDINEFVENILNNCIKTPYYYQSKYKEYFNNMLNNFENTMDKILTPEHNKIFEFIENIKEKIVQKGIESKENLDIDYPNICMNEIINNKLNINEFTSKMFYEYFMCSKAEAQLALTLDKCNETIQNIANK